MYNPSIRTIRRAGPGACHRPEESMSVRARELPWTLVGTSCCLLSLAALTLPVAGAQVRPPEAAAVGKPVYDRLCATCHGARGRGDGPAAEFLSPVPRDFTRGVYKFRTTTVNSLPADRDLDRIVADGLPGTAMPGFRRLLSDGERQDVISYIKRFSPRFDAEKPSPVKVPDPWASTPRDIAAGRNIYERLACATCHGEDGSANEELPDDWGHAIRSTDLTQPWTFRGGATAQEILLRVRTGIAGTPMPSFDDVASEKELEQLADFVVSLARRPVWAMSADELKAFYAQQARRAADNPVERGRYLVNSLSCAHCHSPVGTDGKMIPGMRFAGGMRIRIAPFGDFVSYNLTSDKDTGLGDWSDGEIKAVLTRGTRPDGTRMLPFPMGWPAYARLSESDLNAVVAFLRSLPPVVNKIPPPQPPNILQFLAGKFRWLILKQDPPMTLFAGNAGTSGPATSAANRAY